MTIPIPIAEIFNLYAFTGVLALLIPIVTILVSHQQKMAKLMNPRSGQENLGLMEENASIRAEIQQLRHQLYTLTLRLESLEPKAAAQGELEGRLNA